MCLYFTTVVLPLVDHERCDYLSVYVAVRKLNGNPVTPVQIPTLHEFFQPQQPLSSVVERLQILALQRETSTIVRATPQNLRTSEYSRRRIEQTFLRCARVPGSRTVAIEESTQHKRSAGKEIIRTSDGGIATTFNSCAMNQHFLQGIILRSTFPQHQESHTVGSLKVRSTTLHHRGEIVILWWLDLLDIHQHKVTPLGHSIAQPQLVEVLCESIPALRVRADLIREEVVLFGFFEACCDSLL